MTKAVFRPLISFAKAAPFELWPTLGILSGIAVLGPPIARIGFRNLYVAEAVLFGTLLVAVISALFSSRHRSILRRLFGGRFVLFHLLGAYAVLGLLAPHQRDMNAVRDGMLVFSGLSLALFAFAFSSVASLVGSLRWLVILTSVFNAVRILGTWTLAATTQYKSLTIAHAETDVICASLSLIGLMLLFRPNGRRARFLWMVLAFANVLVLLLAVSRVAMLSLVVVFVLAVALPASRRRARALLRIGLQGMACSVLLFTVLARLCPEDVTPVTALVFGKVRLRLSTEVDMAWRLRASRLAWQRFEESPLLGIGYGTPILRSVSENARTGDPLNSGLAFLVRHGLVGGLLLLAILGQVCVRYARRIRSSIKQEDRLLVHFFLLAFIYMLVFASLGAVLENLHESVFFWLALSGAFLVDPDAAGAESTHEHKADRQAGQNGRRLLASPLAWIRGTATAGAVGYTCLIVSPWNVLPRTEIYGATRHAQVPHAEALKGASIALTDVLGGLGVAYEQRGPASASLVWTLPEELTSDFRLRTASAPSLNRPSPTQWLWPGNWIRPMRGRADYAIVLEFGSRDESRKPYLLRLEGAQGLRREAMGCAVGNRRIVALSELEANGRLFWPDVRDLRLILPYSPRPLAFLLKSLTVVSQTDGWAAQVSKGGAPIRHCANKARITGRTITGFDSYDGSTTIDRFLFGDATASGAARGQLWSSGDGTGNPTLDLVAGADSTRYAIRGWNPKASGWGHSLGFGVGCLDATAFQGVEFWARGVAPLGRAWISLYTKETSPPKPNDADAGGCVGADSEHDCIQPTATFLMTDTWTKVRLAWSDFHPGFNGSTRVTPNGDNIVAFSFGVNLSWDDHSQRCRPSAVELALDELSFF